MVVRMFDMGACEMICVCIMYFNIKNVRHIINLFVFVIFSTSGQ